MNKLQYFIHFVSSSRLVADSRETFVFIFNASTLRSTFLSVPVCCTCVWIEHETFCTDATAESVQAQYMWQVVRYPVLFVLESLDWAINSIFSWMHDSIHLSSSSTLSDYSIISWLIRITSKMNSNSMWWRWRSMVSGSFTISVVSFSILFQWHLACMNPTTR